MPRVCLLNLRGYLKKRMELWEKEKGGKDNMQEGRGRKEYKREQTYGTMWPTFFRFFFRSIKKVYPSF